MKKVSGYLYKRGKVWIVSWQHNGQRHKETTGTGDKRKAMIERDRILAPFRLESQAATLSNLVTRIEETHADRERLDDAEVALPLGDVWEAYEAATNRPDSGPVTLSNYESWWNRFQKWISANRPERKELRDITNEDAQAYAGHLQTMVSPSTFNRHAFFLGLLFKVLKSSGRLHRNPFDRENVTRKKAVQNARDALTVEQLVKVCASVTGEMRTLFAIGVYCGFRLADAALLRWDSIDLAKNVISLIPRKTARRSHKRVNVPIHPSLKGILLETPVENRNGHLMPEVANTFQAYNGALSYRVQKVFKDCKILVTEDIATEEKGKKASAKKSDRKAPIRIGFHSLRHALVTMSVNAGTPLAVLGGIMGHTTERMTGHYHHLTGDAARSAIAVLPDVLPHAEETTSPTPQLAPSNTAPAIMDTLRELVDRMTPETWQVQRDNVLKLIQQQTEHGQKSA